MHFCIVSVKVLNRYESLIICPAKGADIYKIKYIPSCGIERRMYVDDIWIRKIQMEFQKWRVRE